MAFIASIYLHSAPRPDLETARNFSSIIDPGKCILDHQFICLRKGNYKFAFYVLLATVATIITAYFIGEYKNNFAFEDFGNIIQGTFGVAVSLAGAFVVIRLAQLSTLIIEKEK